MRNSVVSIVMAALLLPLQVAVVTLAMLQAPLSRLEEAAWTALLEVERMYREAMERL